jgi:hypothetical protein
VENYNTGGKEFMKFGDAMQLLVCLNDAGVNKACELLGELLQNKDFMEVTMEQLTEQVKEKNRQDKIEIQKKQDEVSAKRKVIRDKYSNEFLMMGRLPISELEMLQAISETENDYFMGLSKAYNWGYIQGKRAVRQCKAKTE